MSITRGELHKRYLKSMENKEEGFTLIELLVVLLIIGILLAIAIPTFLSTTKTAAKTSAQSNLQTALTGADAYWTQANQTFAGIDSSGTTTVSNISAIDTGMTFVSGTSQLHERERGLALDRPFQLARAGGVLAGQQGLLVHHRAEGPGHDLGYQPRHRHLVLGRFRCRCQRLCGPRHPGTDRGGDAPDRWLAERVRTSNRARRG